MSNETIYLLLPEIILVLLATLIYLAGAFVPARGGWSWLSAGAIILAGVALYQSSQNSVGGFPLHPDGWEGPITVDRFAITIRWAVLSAGLLFVMLAARSSEQGESSEFMGSLLLIVAGLNLVALSADLVLFFVGLELVSIPTYLILFQGRFANLAESGTKDYILSILSSALLLYGFSFLYGSTGSTDLRLIRAELAANDQTGGVAQFAPLALILIFAGLGFRLTAVPFHFYAPDVYQGTTNPNAGLLAIVPKIAGMVALARIVFVAMPGVERLGWQISLALAIVTMTLGNLLALWQDNLRRLLAYSSVAHAGYMLIGLAVGFAVAGGASGANNFDGVGATFFYLLVYGAATAGTFAALTYLGGPTRQLDTVDELAGLARNHPKTAAGLSVFMFSLTGLPPLAGFWGKFTLFAGALAVDAQNPRAGSLWYWFLALAIVGAVNAAISAAYYLRIVGVMYFRQSLTQPESRGGAGAAWAVAVCAALVLGIGCYPGPFIEQAKDASRSASAPSDHANASTNRALSSNRQGPVVSSAAPLGQ